jgi:acetate---CoA ligase (ADP-forming)
LAAQVNVALDECIAKGVGAEQIFTARFAKMGDAGRVAQNLLSQKARAANVRVLEPNSLGLFSVRGGFFGTLQRRSTGHGHVPEPSGWRR